MLTRKHTQTIGGIIVALFAIVVFVAIVAVGSWSMRFMKATGLTPPVVFRLIFDGGMPLQTVNGRTNVLILGIGGGNHEGPNLTDTILVLSFDHAKKSLALISVPRDIWSDSLKDKINSAYHYGEEKHAGSGLLLSRVTVEDVIGMPIQYGVVVDFAGFKELIDVVGGVDVVVTTAFTDPEFPRDVDPESCGEPAKKECIYETIHFNTGLQHMDGTTGLKYVRSRHAEGDEGSDFARGRRQQDVLVSLKDKLMQPRAWFTPARAMQLIDVLKRSIKSDMNMSELATVGKWFTAMKDGEIKRIAFESELEVPPSYVYGRYVLVPKKDWEAIATFIKASLER